MRTITRDINGAIAVLASSVLAVAILASPFLVSFAAYQLHVDQKVPAVAVEGSKDLDGVAHAVFEIPSSSGTKLVTYPGKFIAGDVKEIAVDSNSNVVLFNWIIPLLITAALAVILVPGLGILHEEIYDSLRSRSRSRQQRKEAKRLLV